MANIAVLGLGAMGSRMAANLLKNGHNVSVWNRTPPAAAVLVTQGAKQAPTPREAVAGANFVIVMVRDDEASREVWLTAETGALAGIEQGTIAIECSTVTPGWIRELGAACAAHGVPLIEAPVSGSRPQAEAGQLVYLAGRDESVVRVCEPILLAMGSSVQHVGPLGSGALVKLSTNALMGVQVTALAELIGLLRRSGVDVASALSAIARTSAWSPAANYLASSMLGGNFAPQFPVELIEKDFGYAVGAAGSAQAVPTIAAARAVFETAITCGYGEQNMTSVVQLFTRT